MIRDMSPLLQRVGQSSGWPRGRVWFNDSRRALQLARGRYEMGQNNRDGRGVICKC